MEEMGNKSKSVGVRENENARRLLRQLMNERYAGSQSALAAALGLAQGYVSHFLNGGGGFGPKLIRGVSRLDPGLALKMLGIELHGEQPVDAESARTAIASLEEQGYSPEMALWAVRAVLQFGGGADDPEVISVTARLVADLLRNLESLAAHRTSSRNRVPRR